MGQQNFQREGASLALSGGPGSGLGLGGNRLGGCQAGRVPVRGGLGRVGLGRLCCGLLDLHHDCGAKDPRPGFCDRGSSEEAGKDESEHRGSEAKHRIIAPRGENPKPRPRGQEGRGDAALLSTGDGCPT